MVSFSEMIEPIEKATILPPEPSEKKNKEREGKLPGAFWIAVVSTLLFHVVAGSVIYFFVPQKIVHRNLQPLEAVLLIPPPQTIEPKIPPPPPRPRIVRVEKVEPKTPPPPIQPVAPSPEPDIKDAEPPVPVMPPEATPIPDAPPTVEMPIVLPEYNASYLRNLPPPYPSIAKRMRIEGSVRLRALISPEGLPKEVEIMKSSGSSILDDAAIKAVRGWSFVPAKKGTEAVSAWVEIPINFSLINK